MEKLEYPTSYLRYVYLIKPLMSQIPGPFALVQVVRSSRRNANLILFIRDIVSDADKLDAIGYAGIERCRDFSKYRAPNASCDEIEENVVEHMHDKLLKLLDQYIRTDSAKMIGQPLQKEMLDYLENK